MKQPQDPTTARPDASVSPEVQPELRQGKPLRTAQSGPRTAVVPTVSVIVPAMNEARNLPHVLPKIPTWVDEVILVDGNSVDDTVAVARQVLPGIRVVMQPGKGKGDALRTGFAAATGDIIVMIDSDGSTDPEEIGAFVRQLRDGADFVKGSRYMQGSDSFDISAVRSFGNSGITWMVRVLFGGRFSDLCYGYTAFWREFLPVFDIDCDGFEVETLMGIRALKARLKIFEVRSIEHERIYGSSNLHAVRDGWRIFKVIVRERLTPSRVPRQAVTEIRLRLERFHQHKPAVSHRVR